MEFTQREFDGKRLDVIKKFINNENILNVLICTHYFKDNRSKGIVHRDFLFEVLNDENFSFVLRTNIIQKIIPNFDNKILSKLKTIATIRNYFVHINPSYFDKHEQPGEEFVGYHPNPKNPADKIDFKEKYEQFSRLEREVNAYLSKLLKELGFLNQLNQI